MRIGPFKDLVAGLQYVLEQHPEIDRERLAALGASYGGEWNYMVSSDVAEVEARRRLHDQLASGTQRSREFPLSVLGIGELNHMS